MTFTWDGRGLYTVDVASLLEGPWSTAILPKLVQNCAMDTAPGYVYEYCSVLLLIEWISLDF